MKKYGFSVFWSEEDAGYIATCPDFPGLSAFGETPNEAIQQASVALEGFVEVLEETKEPLPDPTLLPEFSGQLRLRIPSSLHKELTERARLDGQSLNSYIVRQLSEKNAFEKLTQKIRDLLKEKALYPESLLAAFKPQQSQELFPSVWHNNIDLYNLEPSKESIVANAKNLLLCKPLPSAIWPTKTFNVKKVEFDIKYSPWINSEIGTKK